MYIYYYFQVELIINEIHLQLKTQQGKEVTKLVFYAFICYGYICSQGFSLLTLTMGTILRFIRIKMRFYFVLENERV